MKTRLWISLITILTLLAVNWPAIADIHPGSRVLGLSTLPNEDGDFVVVDYPPGPLRLYLMVYGYDDPQGIVSWDCALHLPRGVTIDQVQLAGDGVNQYPQAGNFRVQTATPLMPVDRMVLLATIDLLVLTEEEMGIGVGPDPLWGDSGFMGYARQTQEHLREPMRHPHAAHDHPVFNLTHIQANEDIKWQQVKALYRP